MSFNYSIVTPINNNTEVFNPYCFSAASDGYLYFIAYTPQNNTTGIYKISLSVSPYPSNDSAVLVLNLSDSFSGSAAMTSYYNTNTNKTELYLLNTRSSPYNIYVISDVNNPVLSGFTTLPSSQSVNALPQLVANNSYLYTSMTNNGYGTDLIQISLSNPTQKVIRVFNNNQQYFGMTFDNNNNCYILQNDQILQINVNNFSSSSSYNEQWFILPNNINRVCNLAYNNYDGYLYYIYIDNNNNNLFAQIKVSNASLITDNYFSNISFINNKTYVNLVIHDNNFYTGTDSNNTIYYIQNPNLIIPCFKEGSQILCQQNNVEVYVPIQNIRNGTLVKTLLNGYLPVEMIGVKTIFNSGDDKRVKDRLYRLSVDNYPSLLEDLVLTGQHAILVDNITNELGVEITNVMGRVYTTEGKFRLPAFIDMSSIPYEVNGTFNIYHLALQNENYYGNYGIYANGLLVETCSKRYLAEVAQMDLL
uniref:Hedgehog/Intein (Hint) domain-containing protein n=1 Tax=viral metagenome TaxID=1070528 RepID=A0A6C0D1Z4_9ZZZZ